MNWNNLVYSNFMIVFLRSLEPVMFQKNTIIFNEFEDVSNVLFVCKGQIDIGYDINRIVKYKMRLNGHFQIGGFEICYRRRSQVIYKSSNFKKVSGYFIRKKAWNSLSDHCPEIYEMIKSSCLHFYDHNIRKVINKVKTLDIAKMNNRHDYR